MDRLQVRRGDARSQQTSSEFLDDVLLAAADRQSLIQSVQNHGPTRLARLHGFLFEADDVRPGYQAAAMDAHELIGELLLQSGERLFHKMLPLSRAYGHVFELGPEIPDIGYGDQHDLASFLH